jgi:bisphosphoglycerate-independent phosphoglycerate mutase (AlkP superfamily)
MSAFELTEALIPEKNKGDFVCFNFANGMVGHTGIMSAAVQALKQLINV